jgi:hypothetical protein
MRQERSWVSLEGTAEDPSLIGQVFFPFDSDRLDGRDRSAMTRLAKSLEGALESKRVELWFVGFADQRGSTAYNQRLGMRRARAVKSCVDRMLGRERFPLYSSKDALSHGEAKAARGRVSHARMALDRRVDIYSNFSPLRRIRVPTLVVEAHMARRLSRREFRYTAGKDMHAIKEPDPAGDAIQNLMRYWFQPRGTVHKTGSEVRAERKIVTVAATDRVNRVTIETDSAVRKSVFYEVEASNTIVTYEWGPPKDAVTVVWHKREKKVEGVLGNDVSEDSSSRTMILSRDEVGGDPLIFPPDP